MSKEGYYVEQMVHVHDDNIEFVITALKGGIQAQMESGKAPYYRYKFRVITTEDNKTHLLVLDKQSNKYEIGFSFEKLSHDEVHQAIKKHFGHWQEN